MVWRITLVLMCTVALWAQEPEPVIRSNVREVVLDVVVRHKDLSLDNKLKASDFTVTEDGIPQTVKMFRYVGGHEARTRPQVTKKISGQVESGETNFLHEPNFVSIVFGEIGPDSRQNAIEAAKAFLDQEFQKATFAAVFSLGTRLNAVHSFDSDRGALALAVRQAVNGTSAELASASAGVLNQTTYTTAGGAGGVSINSSNAPAATPDFATSGASQAPLSEGQQAIASMIGAQRHMVSNIAGMYVMDGLLRLVEYESRLPGRKTVLYLSEGLIKPPDREDAMKGVISAANRGNISFYCFDVRGLTLATSNGLSAGLVRAAGNAGPQEFNLVAEALSSHVQLNMAELAEGTGGFAVFSTNNFKKNMARVMEDVRTHYELSYVPTSSIYDGRYRQIRVILKDPKLVLQTRDGYFALPDLNGVSVLAYEMEGLRALHEQTRRDFDFHAAALRYRPLSNGFRYEMAFNLSTANLTARVNMATHKARLHGIFLALIKEGSGQIAAKVSREIDREVPEDKLEQFRKGEIVFTAEFDMAPGRYTIEAAVTDPEGNRASTKRIALVVPMPEHPALSSLVMVKEIEPLSAPPDPGNPMEFAGGRVLPALAQNGSDAAKTALFFVVYPQSPGVKPKVTVSFMRDGAEVSRSQPDPGAIDEVNSMPIITAVKLPAGDYVARVAVEQAGRTSSDSIAINVRPSIQKP